MREQGETATSTAALMSSSFSGVGKDMATFQDSVRSTSTLQVDAAQVSKDAAIKQSEATDGLTSGYQQITAQMTTFQNQMEKFATDNLPAYANILAKNAQETMALFQEGVKAAADFTAYVKKKIDEVEGAVKDKAPDKDKVGNALAGAAGGAAAGAVVGSLVPVIGTAVGAAVGGLVGGTIGWFKGNTAQNAEGGLATPGKLNIFGEKGPEAAVPLPDGRTIPVTFDTESLTKMMGSGNDKVMEDLALAIKDLSASMSKGSQTSGPMDVIAKHLEEMKDTAVKQLDAHSAMSDLLGQANTISDRILNNSY
jgi:phage tail tape-measure protein